MIDVKISDQIREKVPAYKVVVIEADIKNPATSDELWHEIQEASRRLRESIEMEQVNKRPAIKATREAYKALGKEPNRYRPSAEALNRRCVKGLELYRSLSVIDLVNLVSIESGHSIGAFDRDAVAGDMIELGVGEEGEPYEAIGRGALNIACLPVFRDAIGGIGTPTSDNDRTKLSETTKKLLITLNIYGSGEMNDEAVTERLMALLIKYASARNIMKSVYRADCAE